MKGVVFLITNLLQKFKRFKLDKFNLINCVDSLTPLGIEYILYFKRYATLLPGKYR